MHSAKGLEILIYIDLGTTRLGGDGLRTCVSEGRRVGVGNLLIDFDLDDVDRKAKSLLTQVVVTNTGLLFVIISVTGLASDGIDGAAVVELRPLEESTQESRTAIGATSDALVVPDLTGLHACLIATLVAPVKQYRPDIQLHRGDDSANAKSIVAIMSLVVACGERAVATAHGTDAKEVAATTSQGIWEGLGEDCPILPSGGVVGMEDTTPILTAMEPVTETTGSRSGDWSLLFGTSVSPELGIDRVVQFHREDIVVEEFAEDRHREKRKLNSTIDQALLDLSVLQKRVSEGAPEEKVAILAAHQEVLGDPKLLDLAVSVIDKGESAVFIRRGALNTFADQPTGLENEILAGRVNDVRDIGQWVLKELAGQRSERRELPESTTFVAEGLTPSDIVQLDYSRVVGFATTGDGVSSHVAVVARFLDIPAVAGIRVRAFNIVGDTFVVLDGSKGTLRTGITDEEMTRLRERQTRMAECKIVRETARDEPTAITDGHRVTVVANIGGVDNAITSMDKSAEGTGLLRNEFVFMGRSTAPTEAEQAQIYTSCVKVLELGQPLATRTLDVGGDKPLACLPIPAGEDPLFGVCGTRVGLEQLGVPHTQIRAALASSGAGAKLHVMLPVIATVNDWRRVKQIFDEECSRVAAWDRVSVGVMMEILSVAIIARQFATENDCDFFSIGTGDLTSYALTMDRRHPKLASQVNPCNPAVLALIRQVAKALHGHGKWPGVYGGIASNPQAAPIPVGLGVDELNYSIPTIPLVKATVCAYNLSTCRALAEKAINYATPAEVRTLTPVGEV